MELVRVIICSYGKSNGPVEHDVTQHRFKLIIDIAVQNIENVFTAQIETHTLIPRYLVTSEEGNFGSSTIVIESIISIGKQLRPTEQAQVILQARISKVNGCRLFQYFRCPTYSLISFCVSLQWPPPTLRRIGRRRRGGAPIGEQF